MEALDEGLEDAEDAEGRDEASLGLDDSEKIIGFIYLGTPKVKMPERGTADLSGMVSNWTGAV